MTLVQELSAEWSPSYRSLNHLWEHRVEFALACSQRSFMDTSADRTLFPLLAFVQGRHEANLSKRQHVLRILPMCLDIVLAVVQALRKGHPLLRPIKEMIVFPGVLDSCKRRYLLDMARYFPSLPHSHLLQ